MCSFTIRLFVNSLKSEHFLKEFREEFQSFYPKTEWKSRQAKKNETVPLLKHILESVFESFSEGEKEITSAVYKGFEYYRLVRNGFAHIIHKDKKLKNMHLGLADYSSFYIAKFKVENAPNPPDKIDFNDFLLLTNIIKNIGYKLSEYFKPPNKVIAEKVCELEMEIKIDRKLKKVKTIKQLRKLKNNKNLSKNNKTRYFNAVQNLLNTHYGHYNDEDTKDILQYIDTMLA